MKIAICDDNKQELIHIRQLVEEYLSSSSPQDGAEIRSFENSTQLLEQIESDKHFDVYLLDVIMPNFNGLKLADEIRKKDQIAKIIFLTSSPEFAVDSYSVGAFDYLLKPIQKDRLHSALERACKYFCEVPKQYIVVKTQASLCKVFLHELVYIEAMGRATYFHQNSGIMIISTGTISQVEEVILHDKRFIKPHRSYIVNLDYVKNMSQEGFTTTNGSFIPISRTMFKEVKQAYINYSFKAED